MKQLTIIPAVHRKVRDPMTQEVLSETKPTTVEATSYWLRRLRMGDVVLVETTAPKSETVSVKLKKKKTETFVSVEE